MAVQILTDKDVVVVGGGSAGIAAAIAAARNGANVFLVEKNGVLGGTSVIGWVTPYMNFRRSDGEDVISGYIDEVIDRMRELGGSPGPLQCTGMPPWARNPTVTPMNPNILAGVYADMVREEGVEVLLNTFVTDALLSENRVRGIIIENKSGRRLLLAKTVVDASGDGDVAYLAGADYELGRPSDGLMQPVTLYFRIGNVNVLAIHDYLKKNPQEFRWWAIPHYTEDPPPEFEPNPITFSGFTSLIAEAKKRGELHLGRETLNGFAVLGKGEVVANTTRVNRIDGTKPEDLTKAEMDARLQVRSFIGFARKYLPGFSNCYLVDTAMSIGVRETRRILGDYQITKEDIVSGTEFEDVIAHGAYAIDIHNPDDERSTWIQSADSYEIPYRSLLPKDLENILVAGRCISTTHEAHAATRVIPNCMAMGVAAGTAASLAVEQSTTPRALNIRELQKRLVNKMGAKLRIGADRNK